MTELPAAAPSRNCPSRLALYLCLAFLLGSYLFFRAAPDPWDGRLGNLIFGKERAELGKVEKYTGAIRFFFDVEAEGRKKFRVEDWIHFGHWMGGLGMTLASLVFAATAPWWSSWSRGAETGAALVSGWSSSRASRALLLVAVVAAAIIRLPTLGGGILWDEQDNHRRNYHGYLDFREPGEAPKWVEATWKNSLWENERGNNPHLYSLLAWGSNGIWRVFSGAPRERSSIIATRAPAALFGILSIVSLWWMLNAAGLPRIAPLAALLAAGHPLYAEFSMEARAYALTLFLTPIMLVAAWRMVRLGRLRDYGIFGLTVFLSLLAFPGALYGIATVNLTVAGFMLWQWKNGDQGARARFSRWVVANSIAATSFLCFLAPAIPQMAAFMNNAFQSSFMPPYWYVVSYNLLSTGMHFGFPREWFSDWQNAPSATGWLGGGFWEAWPVALWSLVLMPALLIAGLVRWFRQGNDRVLFAVAVAMLAGGVVCVAHHALVTGYYIYAWYTIYILPVILAAAAMAIDGLADWLSAKAKKIPSVPLAAGLAIFAMLWMVGQSHPKCRPKGWEIGQMKIHPRPAPSGWNAPAGQIGRQIFQRNRSLWVVYEDGYHAWFRDHAERAEEWKPIMDRPLEKWGQFP